MRNVLLTLTLLLCFGMSFGQIKVVSDGDVLVGPNPSGTPDDAGFKAYGTAELEIALDAGSGAPDFSMQVTNQTKAAFRYNPGLNGGSLEVLVDAPNTGSAGLGGGARGIVIEGTNRNIGMGINPTSGSTCKLDVAGNVCSNGGALFTTPATSSAKNKSSFNYGLKEVLSLNTIGFDNEKSNQRIFGVSASDFEAITPELTKTITRTVYKEQTAAEIEAELPLEVITKEDVTLVNETAIPYMLINAIQEQQEMIDAKDAQIETLTERLAALETAVLNLSNGTVTNQVIEVRDSKLAQNAPNPFNETTVISYAVPSKASTAVLQIFDLNGQLLRAVNVAKGNGQLTINAGELAAGTYTYNLVVDGAIVDTKKMVLTK